MPWTALIGAGTSLLGGLFGRSKEKRERRQALEDREYARGHYARLVEDASAAGFNPLTALRNGGGAGYASSSAPILSSGGPDPMQTALSQVGNFIANFDPHADKAREKGYALLDAQIRNLNASSGAIFPAMPGGFHSPGTYGGTFEGRPSGRAGVLSSVPLPVFRPDSPAEEDRDKMINPFPVGSDLEIPGHLKSAEAWENVMGEAGGLVGGLYNMGAILRHNFNRQWDHMIATRKRVEDQPRGWRRYVPRFEWRYFAP